MSWEPGAIVEHRHTKDGVVWWRSPARVIEDSAEVTVLWWPAGTRYQRAAVEGRLDHLRVLAAGGWELEDAEWTGGDALHIVPRGEPFSIWPFRSPNHELLSWYCNLQAPLVRTAIGFDTDDWTLDVVATADLSRWSYKDEDELAEGERVGLYDAGELVEIRAAGARVVALIESRSSLFETWSAWQADRSWAVPTF